MGEKSYVGRIGGDEFAVLLPECASPQEVASSAQTLVSAMDRPLIADQHLIFPLNQRRRRASAQRHPNARGLMLLADRALYRAKNEGRNRFCLYDDRIDHEFEENSQLSRQLADALAQNQFELYYQPQIDLHRDQSSVPKPCCAGIIHKKAYWRQVAFCNWPKAAA